MKAITIKEPWASLIINGYKEYEFRTWKTKYRGKILIHASITPDKKNLDRFKKYNLDYASGKIIGEAEIVDCILVDDKFNKELNKKNDLVYNLNNHNNLYAFCLKNIKKYKNKISCKGQLGIWNFNYELRDLYDENREPIGMVIKKEDMIPEGYYCITVAVFIQNKKGEFLIQKRTKDKGGKWATTSGHPVSGQTNLEGLITEVKEELGINLNPNDVKLFKTIRTEDIFFDMYYINMEIDINNIVMQKEELTDVKWSNLDEIEKIMDNDEFHKKHKKMFKDCFEYLKNEFRHN